MDLLDHIPGSGKQVLVVSLMYIAHQFDIMGGLGLILFGL